MADTNYNWPVSTQESRIQRRLEQQAMLEKQESKKKKKKKRGTLYFIYRFIMFIIGFILNFIFTTLFVGVLTGGFLAIAFASYIYTAIIPESTLDISAFAVNENSLIFHVDPETGQYAEALTIHSTTNSIWKEYEEFPESLIKATVAIEDKRFWTHNGVDWWRTGAAAYYLFTGSSVQGGSTITQQLIKNVTTFNDVTVKRKIIEIFRALDVENNNTKEEILQYYLNIIYLGEKNYGVGAASWSYFGKDVSDLSLAEAASIIAITNNPTIYGPYSSFMTVDSTTGEMITSRDLNKRRQELILYELYMQDGISAEEYVQACAEELNFVRAQEEEDDFVIYTWFEEVVINDVRDDLMEKYGYSKEAASKMISSGGLSIYTTLDPNVQALADSIYQNTWNLNVPALSGQPLQSAITIIDNASGAVVAVVGSMGTKEQNLLYNYATDVKRQPGSSLKPLSTYALALDLGYISPTNTVSDSPYMYQNGSPWPSNAYGFYAGDVTLEFALEHSSNAVAANIVGKMLTPESSFEYLTETMQLDLVYQETFGGQVRTDCDLAPLALGGLTLGVTTREMATAYASFANQGLFTESRTYTKVINSKGELILDNTKEQYEAMTTSTAVYMNQLLEVVIDRGTGMAAKFDGMTMAGKTGTTNNKFDLWFVGYTPYYTAAVWTGYEYNEEIDNTTNPAMTMWKNVMEPLHANLPDVGFDIPPNMTPVDYCLDSGCIANVGCYLANRVGTRNLSLSDTPTEICTTHYGVEADEDDAA